MELSIKAEITWSGDGMQPGPPDVVVVYMGETVIAELPITTKPSDYYPQYLEDKDRRMIEETVAPFLRKIFKVEED